MITLVCDQAICPAVWRCKNLDSVAIAPQLLEEIQPVPAGSDEHPPPTPGWKLAGFGSQAEAEACKARYRAQNGPTSSFPWDTG